MQESKDRKLADIKSNELQLKNHSTVLKNRLGNRNKIKNTVEGMKLTSLSTAIS